MTQQAPEIAADEVAGDGSGAAALCDERGAGRNGSR
jgi:hypothetical protein